MLSAFIASSLVLGAFAQYAQLNTYMDPACSTDLMAYLYTPISSLRVYPFTGTCTATGGGSAPYSVKATIDTLLDTTRVEFYSTIDCAGSVLFSLTDTTTCMYTGSGYTKMVSYDTTVSDSGLKISFYSGTDASTDTCTASTGVYYEVFPFDTCL